MRSVIFAAAASVLTVSASSQGVAPVAPAPASAPFKKEFVRAYRLKAQNRDAEAAVVFSAILAKDPSNHAALTELGYLNVGLKHYETAALYLRSASAQDPENMRLRMDLAYALQTVKRPDDAAVQFRYVAEHVGEFQAQAQKALDATAGQAPAETPAGAKQRRMREQGYGALRRGDKVAAAKAFRSAIASDATDAAAFKQLGFLNIEAGRYSEAASNFESARALQPTDLFVALQLGYTYDRLQKKDQAREAFGAAAASDDEKIRTAAQAALQSSGPAAPVSSL
jgi:Flp pilus assembly protein TadD